MIRIMPGERLSFTTSTLNKTPINREQSYTMEGFDVGDCFVEEIIDFGNDSFGWLRHSKTESARTTWSNAVCVDLKKGLEFFYDYNFFREALPIFFGPDIYQPYQGAI